MGILLEAPENFRKLIILYKFHVFCILVALQYFDGKITFDDKVIQIQPIRGSSDLYDVITVMITSVMIS